MKQVDLFAQCMTNELCNRHYHFASSRDAFTTHCFMPHDNWQEVYVAPHDNPFCIVRSKCINQLSKAAEKGENAVHDLQRFCTNLITHCETLPAVYFRVVPITIVANKTYASIHHNEILNEDVLRPISFPYKGDLLA